MSSHLAELKWHWGSAYAVSHPQPDVWLAQRRNDRRVLKAETPGELLDLIRQDYAADPVPRG